MMCQQFLKKARGYMIDYRHQASEVEDEEKKSRVLSAMKK
jgi:hypothetical protein